MLVSHATTMISSLYGQPVAMSVRRRRPPQHWSGRTLDASETDQWELLPQGNDPTTTSRKGI
jgi:hypothetical protein